MNAPTCNWGAPLNRWTNKQLNKFADAAQSLKLYRRAELLAEENDKSLIEQLYVDPLPQDGAFQTMMRPNTTFLIGRKGTGKSTIFQRAQHEIRQQEKSISAYLDIKTIFESSEVDPALLQKIEAAQIALPSQSVRRIFLFEEFIRAVLLEIRSELRTQIDRTFLSRLKDRVFSSSDEVFEALDELIESSKQSLFADVTGLRTASIKEEHKTETAADFNAEAKTEVSTTGAAKASGKASANLQNKNSGSEGTEFSQILLRTSRRGEIHRGCKGCGQDCEGSPWSRKRVY